MVAQRRVQLAERTTESAMSGVGQVADAVRIARAEAATAAANAQSAIGTVQTLTMSLSAHTEEATAKAVSEMEARVQQVASYSDAETSQATATLQQQLESKLVSVVVSADETATKRMHDAEACIQRGVEAELQKNQADTRREVEQTRTVVDDIATRLDQLTTQLNEYRPVQEATVAAQGEKLSSNVETRLQMQSSHLDDFAKSLQEAREEQHSTAETLQTILVSLENLSENFRRLQEEQL